MKITTTGLHASMQGPADVNPHGNSPIMLASLSTIGLFGMILAGGFKKRGRWQGAVLGVLVLVSTLSFVGCGSSSSKPITPAGSYTVIVNATGTAGTNSGNTTPHPFNLTITVK
jgi:predicted benzoate:H+ symporter BenE